MDTWDVVILTGGLWAAVLIWGGITGWLEERDRKALKKWRADRRKDPAQLDWIDDQG